MKIKNLMLKNFAKVSEISVSIDENVTYLIGENGSGKTTLGLNGVWFVLKGLAQKGEGLTAERFRFIGPHGKSASASITLFDKAENVEIYISRKLLKYKTELKIEASDGRQLDQAWLDSMFNAFLIDPVGFSKLSGKAQALAFGVDTTLLDKLFARRHSLELERRDIGRDVTRMMGVVESAGDVEKVDPVDVKGLMVEFDKRQEINNKHKDAQDELIEINKKNKIISSDIKELEASLIIAHARLKEATTIWHSKANAVKNLETADEQEIKDQIESAQEVNQKATAYTNFEAGKVVLSNFEADYEKKSEEMLKVDAERTKYLKSIKLPWPNITITDEGEFRLNDKPFSVPYFSTGEILKFGARIGSKLKDGLKYVFIPHSEVLDDKNRETLFKGLNKDGFQIMAESVGTEKKKEASILLKEMKVVESYDEAATDGKTLS